MRSKLLLLAVACGLGLSMQMQAHAQVTGTISGYITDTTGASIQTASVTITEEGTGTSRTLKSDSSGRFVANLVPVGHYTIDVSAPGFQEQKRVGLNLEAQGTPEISVTMLPASVSQTVNVQGAEVAVQTTEATLGQVIHSEQVADLPLNGRDFVQLALLTPGATAGDQPTDFFSGGTQAGSEVSIRGSYSLSVGGSRENRTDWLYDGVDNNELTAGGIAVMPSIDALDEFNVLTFNYSVQYGARAGPTVLLTSKSGSNRFHGSLFEFLRNTDLNSRNYFSQTNPKYIQNQFGGSVGGPIIRNKMFFFFDYAGTRNIQGIPYVAQVPTALERQGIFTESFPGAPEVPVYDPTMPGRPQFQDNSIPTPEINQIALKMLSYLPMPNVPGVLFGNYLSVPNRTFNDNEFDFRIDDNFSAKDRVFARFSRDQASVFNPSGLPAFGGQPGGYGSNQTLTDHGRNLAISETHIFSNHKINQATVGYNRIFNHIVSYGDGTNWSDQLGIPNANLGTYFSSGFLNTQFSSGYWGLGDRGYSPFQGGSEIYHYADDFEYIHGQHSFSMGGGMRFMQMNVLGDAFPMGELAFDNLWTAQVNPDGSLNSGTGNPIASFLLGLPAGGEHDNAFTGTITGRRWKEFRPYFQDSWKIRKNLTVQLGLAYNYTTPIVEARNRQSNFDFTTGTLLIAGVNANTGAGVQPYKKDFEPRVGIAYSPFSDKNSIRAGYAILHDAGWNLGAPGLTMNPPFFSTYSFQSDDVTLGATPTLSVGFPTPVPENAGNLSGNIFSEPTNFRPGMIQQYNLNVQRQLPAGMVVTIGYAGSRASHLQTMNWNLNTAPPNLQIDPPNLRPYPQFFDINGFIDRGLSRYDSLQVKAEKTARHGFYLLFSYTYSKGFDNGLNDDLGSLVGVPYYPLTTKPHADKALSLIDQTNNFSASVVYQLPFGRGQHFMTGAGGLKEQLVGKWQFNVISHMASGFPLGLATGVNNSGTAIGNRPNQVCGGSLSHKTANEFFNVNCFIDPPAGVLGDANRTPLFGPDFINFDASLFKSFGIRENVRLQFRTEIFNVFNHPQFALPGTFTDSAGFGVITSTVNNPRLIQFALKLLF